MTSRRPRALRPGDLIGITAPASPVARPFVERGLNGLRERGYRLRIGSSVGASFEGNDYLAGGDASRADELNGMLADPDIAAIWCARGGYGTARLLPRLELSASMRIPILVGYSDITSLHAAIEKDVGAVTFHGPVVTNIHRMTDRGRDAMWTMLENPSVLPEAPADPALVSTVCGGTARGLLTGGCISLLAAACGTPWQPDFTGKIVLLEDVGEPIYRADRYLTQLANAGLLNRAAGFVIGSLTGWREAEKPHSQNTPERLWEQFFAGTGKPTIAGFPFGHEPGAICLPLGVEAELDAEGRALRLLAPAVTTAPN